MRIERQLDPEPQDAMSRKLTHALEAAPTFTIPAGFAARMAAAAAELPVPAAAGPRAGYTRPAIHAAFTLLTLALVGLAAWARTAPNSQQTVLLGVEIALALEFVALTTWLSLRPPSTS
jgi:hypothetical protein